MIKNNIKAQYLVTNTFPSSLSQILQGMVLLGWTAEAGAMAQVKNIGFNSLGVTEMDQEIYLSQGAGYGWACFCYLMGSLSAITIAIYISPDIASEYEKRILTTQFYVDPHADVERAHAPTSAMMDDHDD